MMAAAVDVAPRMPVQSTRSSQIIARTAKSGHRISRHASKQVLAYLLRYDDVLQADDAVGAALGLSPATIDREQQRWLKIFHRQLVRYRNGLACVQSQANEVEAEAFEEGAA